jgi:hypothetical protein
VKRLPDPAALSLFEYQNFSTQLKVSTELFCHYNIHLTMKRKLDEHDIPKEVQFWDSAITFDKLGLDSRLLQAITHEKFSTPTPIQARAIPLAFEGKDILGLSSLLSATVSPLMKVSPLQNRLWKNSSLRPSNPPIHPRA